jgi:hypothetical protein
MHKEHIAYLREHAHALVKLARKQQCDQALAGELEELAIELLKRASELERGTKF